MIVDGRAIAGTLLFDVRKDVEQLPVRIVVRAIVVTPSPATESYLATKAARAEEAGMHLEVVKLPDEATTEDVIRAVEAPGCDALIVQLPLPGSIDTQKVLDAIPLKKDADVLSSSAYARFKEGTADALVPPVAGAVAHILETSGVEPRGMNAVVIGQGRLVGEPAATWLTQAGATVTVLTRESTDRSALARADLIVAGAGVANLIRPEDIKEGVVLIDAGTSESDGAIVGDADPACSDRASVFTPVPGGVGPVAVACLFKNVARLVLNNKQGM